jgi:hypothetical protein
MSSRSVSDIQTRAEGESLDIRYRSDANDETLIKHSFLLNFPRELLMNFLIIAIDYYPSIYIQFILPAFL